MFLIAAIWIVASGSTCSAADHFLTIGGGYSPSGNQASIERNVLFFQRVLSDKQPGAAHTILFSDGNGKQKDVQVIDRDSVPLANRLMADFFGDRSDLGLTYRNHEIDNVSSSTSPTNIRKWFKGTGSKMKSGDRLFLYVTAHGSSSEERNEPYQTSISLWGRQKISVKELSELMDALPEGVSVVTVMVQCHAGGFARAIYEAGDDDKGFHDQSRVGFFATVHDRPAAGCTSDADESTYVEYSTFFWEALSGKSRLGESIDPPDYNKDGSVSFEEAHAYTIIQSNTIDLPIKTSGELLGVESGFRDRQHPDLLPRDTPSSKILEQATESEREILTALSKQLDLEGENRVLDADRMTSRRSRGRGRTSVSENRRKLETSRKKIAGSLRSRWPSLSNLLNPEVIELLTTESEVFVRAVQEHPEYAHFCRLRDTVNDELSSTEKRVKYERFVRTAENVILRINLYKLDNKKTIAKYEAIVANENGTL